MKQLQVLLAFLVLIGLVIGAHLLLDLLMNTDPNMPPPAEVLESVDAPPTLGEVEGDRSGSWPTVRKRYLEQHPTCEACGGSRNLHVHHVVPFHNDPSLELDMGNLITLCAQFEDADGDGENDRFNCHFRIGHDPDGPDGPRSPNWKAANPNVRQDARRYYEQLQRSNLEN